MSRYRRYNDGNGGKIVAFIVAIVLILCTVLGIVYREHVAIIWGDVSRYFGRVNEEPQEDEKTPSESDKQLKTNSFLPGDVENNGVALTVARLSAAEVSAQAESGYTVTATVLPEYATDKTLDWEISFVDTSDSWTTGKNCADYVTVTPTADGAATAVMENYQPFNSQMLLTVRSRSNPEVYSTVTLDYRRRVIGTYFELKNAADETVKHYDMGINEDLDISITNDICGGLLPSGGIKLSEGTVGTIEDFDAFYGLRADDDLVAYMDSNGFPFEYTNIPVDCYSYMFTDIENWDLKYLALYLHWYDRQSVYTSESEYYNMTWTEYKAARGAEFLSLMNSGSWQTKDAYIYVIGYYIGGYNGMNVSNQRTNEVYFSYQEDYFPISVESVETDTGNVEF